MSSITEVLAQAVYELNLKDLPLDSLESGQRQVSTGRPAAATPSTRHEIAPPRLSSFSAISEGPPGAWNPVATCKPPDKDLVDGAVRSLRPGSASMRGLFRSATEEEEGSMMVDIPIVKRHSTPITTGSRPSCSSLLNTITEFASPEHPKEDEASESEAVMTPYQQLMEEEEEELLHGPAERDEDGGAVIANLNARSPTPTGERQPRPFSSGSSTPSQSHPPSVGSPTPSQEETKTLSPTPSQEEVREKGRNGHKKLLPAHIFKHRGKGRGSDSPVLSKQRVPTPVEERKRRRKWFHKRSGSDSVMAASRDHLSVGNREEELGVASLQSSPNLGALEQRRYLGIRKSSSDGNIHKLLLYGGGNTLPDTGPDPIPMKDNVVPFRRVTTIASPTPMDSTANRGAGGVVSSSSASSHRPLRRSLTVDSPEPILTGTC